jgi:hypothetical protein
MPELAKLIEVEREGNKSTLRINGEEFAWHIAPGVDLHIERDHAPSVTLTIMADEVQVADRFRPPPPPEVGWLLLDAKSESEIGRYSTAARLLENDIVSTADDRLWRIEHIDPVTLCLHVARA